MYEVNNRLLVNYYYNYYLKNFLILSVKVSSSL